MKNNTPYWVLIPSIILTIVIIAPLVYLIFKSVNADSNIWEWIFRWQTLLIVIRTLTLVATVSIISLIIALPLSILTTKTDLPFKFFFTILHALPLVIPSYVGAYLFMTAFSPKGLFYKFISNYFEINSIPNLYGFWGAVIVLSLLNFPYLFLTLRASLIRIDPEIEESAKLLGLNDFSIIYKIIIPQLKPAIFSGILLISLYTLSDFGAVSLLRFKTFTWAIFLEYETGGSHSAAILSVGLFIIAMKLIIFESLVNRNFRYHAIKSVGQKTPLILKLKKLKIPAVLLCLIVFSFSLLVPISVLSFWLIRGIYYGEIVSVDYLPIFNSVYISMLTTVTVILFAIPLSFLAIRHKSILGQALERLSFIGFALPTISVSLGLVYIGARIGSPIYQSTFMLITGCLILCLPVALGPIKSRLLQINPNLEDAGKTLGYSNLMSTFRITIPILTPGLFMSSSLVFFVTMKELPAVLFLSPLNFPTLSTRIWSYTSEAFFAKAAVPSLILIFCSSIIFAIFLYKSKLDFS